MRVTEGAFISRSEPNVLIVRTHQHVNLGRDVQLPLVRVVDANFARGLPATMYECTCAVRVRLVEGDAIAVFGGDLRSQETHVKFTKACLPVTRHLLGPLSHYPVPFLSYEPNFWEEMLFSRLRDTVTTEAAADLSLVLLNVDERTVARVLVYLHGDIISSASLEKIADIFPHLPSNLHTFARTA